MKLLSLLALLMLTACAQKPAPTSENLQRSTALHAYPADPIAAGWDKPLTPELLPVQAQLQQINEEQDRALANTSEKVVSIPVEPSEFRDVEDNARHDEDRSHDDPTIVSDSEDDIQLFAGRMRGKTKPKPKSPGPAPQAKTWDNVLSNSDLRDIKLGASILGPVPHARHDSDLFVPASITKLVTTARALEILGPDFRFETKLVWRDLGNGVAAQVTVTGNGDPTLGSPDFQDDDFTRLRSLIQQMKAAGVEEVRGPIVFISADKRWDTAVHAPGVEDKDAGFCYGALSGAFNLHENCATVVVDSASKVYWRDSGIQVPLKVNITVGKTTSLAREVYFDNSGAVSGFGLRGTFGKKQGSFSVAFPVPDSKSWVKNVFLRQLDEEGVRYSPNDPMRGSGDIRSATTFSPTLAEILVPMLKHSDNFLADTLFKRVGINNEPNLPLREASQNTIASGIAQWMSEAGFPHMKDEVLLLDGAGLSRNNHTSPRAYLAMLKIHSTHSYFNAIWRALPIAGVDGTLKNRLKSANLRGVVRAKTGTLRGSYQLAGFMPKLARDGSASEFIPFVLLTSAPEGFGAHVFTVQEKLLAYLGKLVNPVLPPVSNRRP